MASSASSSKGKKPKDPNAPDYVVITLKAKYLVYNKKADELNRKWVDHLNQIRVCRNNYIEASTALQGKDRRIGLQKYAELFWKLIDKVPEKAEAVEKAGAIPVPFQEHLKRLPSLATYKK